MYRVGIVKAQDATNARVRVIFPDRDHMESWLPVVFTKTQNDKMYWIPDIGEQVVCTTDEYDEDGAVLGAMYSSVDRPPATSADKIRWTFKDGAAFEYDRSVHSLQMNISNGGTVTITANGASIAIDSSGNVAVMASGQILLAGGGPGVARIGDTTICPAGTGHIASGSSKVNSG
jgi:phage baseplate assembly protein V